MMLIFSCFVIEPDSKYMNIKKYFSQEEWLDMSEYLKESYFNQWENWMMRSKHGFSAHPPFVSAPKNNLKNRQKSSKIIKPGDNEWTPKNKAVETHIAYDCKKISCGKCGQNFKSVRICTSHELNCVPSAQGIRGRHLDALTDKDLQDMGLAKGSRLDVLSAVRSFKEATKENAVSQNELSYETDVASYETVSSHGIFDDDIHDSGLQRHPWDDILPTQLSDEDVLSAQYPSSSVSVSPPLVFRAQSPVLLNSNNSNFRGTRAQCQSSSASVSSPLACSMQSAQSPVPHHRLNQPLNPLPLPVLRDNSNSSNIRVPGTRAQCPSSSASVSSPLACSMQSAQSPVPHHRPNQLLPLNPLPNSNNSNVRGTRSQCPSKSASVSSPLPCSTQSAVLQYSTTVNPGPSNDVSNLNSDERVDNLIRERSEKFQFGFNIIDILNASRGGSQIAQKLEKDGFVNTTMSKSLSKILMTHINDNVGQNNPVIMREEMAITLVAIYPKLRKTLYTPADMPWHHWFNPTTNTGILQHANQGIQRSKRKETGEGFRRSKKVAGTPRQLVEAPQNRADPEDPDPEDFIKNVAEAANLLPEGNRENILTLMTKTFSRRRHLIKYKGVLTSELIRDYPHFLSFEGEVINHEFRLMHPNSSGLFLRNFSFDYVPKLLKIASNNPVSYPNSDYFGDDLLNALVVLAKFLPTPRRTYAHEARQPLHAKTDDLFYMIPLGSNPRVEANKKRQNAQYYVQPHIMAIGHPRAIGKMFLVLGDSELLELPRAASPTNAIDLLLKTYFVLNLHHPLGWKNAFRFIQVHIYHIPPENARESSFDNKHTELKNTML